MNKIFILLLIIFINCNQNKEIDLKKSEIKFYKIDKKKPKNIEIKELKIGSLKYKIRLKDFKNNDIYGYVDFPTKEIILNKKLDKDVRILALTHEIFHILLRKYELENDLNESMQERICTNIGEGIIEILKENPDFIKSIKEE
jgi:Zn-dependent peptidase ImmA (M78 family)